jgi:single-strand DNA-binding protein
MAGSLIQSGRLRSLYRLPLAALRHATASTVPRVQGQGRPPGQATGRGRTMTEASVSFAGNLTDQPELRHTEGGIARAMFRVAVSGRREQEASFFTVIVWRDQAEHAAESLTKGSRVVVVGRLQQRSWTAEDGSARSVVEVVADELGPSLTGAPALGNGDDDQGDAEPGAVARLISDATSGTRSMPAFHSVVSALVSFVGRGFSTNSRPALRAAACGGRPRAGSDTTVTRHRPHPPPKEEPHRRGTAEGWRRRGLGRPPALRPGATQPSRPPSKP